MGAENYANFIFISLICGVGQSLAKLGQNDYLIVTKKLSESTISGIFTLNILFAIIISTILFLIFFLIVTFSTKSDIFMLSAILMSISVFLSISSNTFLAFLQKRQEFKKLFLINISSSLSSVLITYILSEYIEEVFYPIIFALGTSISLFVLLAFSKLFKLNLSKLNLINFFNVAKTFMIPLTKTRPILVATKNIDVFLVMFIGGDLLLVAYNTLKKLLIYPLTILYGILDRWLYPLMAKLEDRSEVNSTYFKVLKNLFLVSCATSLIIIALINFFNASIINYFSSIGVSNINVMTLCYGFILSWPILSIPTLIYPYAKVIKKTHLLPSISIFQALVIFFSFLFIYFINNHDLLTFGYLTAFLLMNIYISARFKFISLKR